MSEALADFHEVELASEDLGKLVKAIDPEELCGKYLWDGRPFLRRNAALAVRLGAKLEEGKEGLLAVAAKDTDEVVREHVVGALGTVEIDVDLALKVLFGALLDPVEAIRETAQESLDRLVDRAPDDLVVTVVSFLADSRGLVRSTAGRMLLRLGEPTVDQLLVALRSDNEEMAKEAFKVLSRLGTVAAPALVKALESKSQRITVTNILCALPALEDAERKTLQGYLEDEDEDLVAAAEKALKEAGTAKGPVVQLPLEVDVDGFLEGRLEDDVLGKAKLETDLLGRAINDTRWFVRANALDVLKAQLAKVDEEERGSLIFGVGALIRDESAAVRKAALSCLGASASGDAATAVIAGLTDPDPEVADTAKSSLTELAETECTAIVSALSADASPKLQQDVVSLIATLGKDTATEAAELLAADRPLARELAARILGHIGADASKTTDALLAALQDENGLVREAVVNALGFVGADHDGVQVALLGMFSDSYPLVRQAASRAVARLKGETLPGESPPEPEPIDIEGFYDEFLDEKDLAKAAKDLESARLCAALSDGRAPVKGNSATMLGVLGDKADEDVKATIVMALSSLIHDDSVEVRQRAVQGLAAIATPDTGRALVDATADLATEVSDVAEEAIKALAASSPAELARVVGPQAPLFCQDLVVSALAEAGAGVAEELADFISEAETVFTKGLLVSALGAMGKDAKKALPALLTLLSDSNDTMRSAAARALGQIVESPDDDVLAALELARSDSSPNVRREAVFSALRIKGEPLPGEVAEPPEPIEVDGFHSEVLDDKAIKAAAKEIGVERLTLALADGRDLTRANASAGLGTFGSKGAEAGASLAVCLRDSNPAVRAAAATALGSIGEDAGVEALVSLLLTTDDPAEAVAEAAVEAVKELGKSALHALAKAFEVDVDRALSSFLPLAAELGKDVIDVCTTAQEHIAVPVRANGIALLGLLGPDHADATREIVETALGDESDLVRERAGLALDLIDGIEPPPAVLEEQELPVEGFATSSLDTAGAKKAAKNADGDRLRELLFDGRDKCRENAARAFATMGKDAHSYVPSLILALKDYSTKVRIEAAKALGELTHDEEACVPALAACLVRANEELAEALVDAVEAFGKKAADPLMGLLVFRADWVLATLGTIAKRMHKDLVKPLGAAATNGSLPNHRWNAIDVLCKLGDDAKGEESTLVDLLDDVDVLVRAKAAKALGSVGVPSDELEERLTVCATSDRSGTVRAAGKVALQYLRART